MSEQPLQQGPVSSPGPSSAERAIAGITGVALSVGDNLRVLALSPKARQILHLPVSDILGRHCYEVMSLVDAETGRPCRERCPLAPGKDSPGWAHTRVLDLKETAAGKTRLDCLLLKTRDPKGEKYNLCLLGPAPSPTAGARVPQAIESIYPVISAAGELKEVLAQSLHAVLHAAAANGGEVFLLDPDSRELALTESQGLPAAKMAELRESAFGDRLTSLMADSRLPLLATGRRPGASSAEAPRAYLCAPLVAEGRVLGALAVASQRPDFDVAMAARALFPVAAQLGVYLRWTYLAGDASPRASDGRSTGRRARLRVSCLGPFRVVLDGKPVPSKQFKRLKALTLLKYLVAHRGRPVRRENLMELLWPGADPARTNGNLRVVLHALRRGLDSASTMGTGSSFVVSQDDVVYLESSMAVWVDAEEFVQKARQAARLVSQGRLEEAMTSYRRAALLYQGEYMEDEPYSDWCLFERERLREVYVDLMKQMASRLAEIGKVGGAIDAYRAVLGIDRGREELHRELMLLLWKDGRRDEALRQYEVCRMTLREELGVEPARATQGFYQAMLAGAEP